MLLVRPSDMLTPADVARAVSGDEKAVRLLLRHIGPTLSSLTRKIRTQFGLPEHLEEDLIQEVFLALFENPDAALLKWDPQNGRSLKNYLAVFARFRVIERLRRLGHSVSLPDEELAALVEALHQRAGNAAGSEMEFEVLELLQKRYRDVVSSEEWEFFNAWLEGASTDELVARFEISSNSAFFQRVARMRKQLRKVLLEMEV